MIYGIRLFGAFGVHPGRVVATVVAPMILRKSLRFRSIVHELFDVSGQPSVVS
jgi:hypothetical protein